MFDYDLLLAFIFMTLLFLRQISILKQPNKINYAPLMLGIGAISSTVHFIVHPETTDVLLIFRESLFPLLVALLLYIVMNILHQTQQALHVRTQQDFTKALIDQITQLKEFTSELEKKMILNQNEDRLAQEEVREKFKHEIKALDNILNNQDKFLDKFSDMEAWHKDVTKTFANFTDVQLPSLDDVVHKHIDILRVAEQDHFNKVKATLERAVESRCDIIDDIDAMKENLNSMSKISSTISDSITNQTTSKLMEVTLPFEKQVLNLKSHAESLTTALSEDETKLMSIRDQSEMIMKQMILSSKKMSSIEEQNSNLHDVFMNIKVLIDDIEHVKSEYVKSQSQLSNIVSELKNSNDEDIDGLKEQIESLTQTLTANIDHSLEKLHKHYHIANEDISQSVQFLAKQAQLKKGYTPED